MNFLLKILIAHTHTNGALPCNKVLIGGARESMVQKRDNHFGPEGSACGLHL